MNRWQNRADRGWKNTMPSVSHQQRDQTKIKALTNHEKFAFVKHSSLFPLSPQKVQLQ
jgi:hypothetical protein